MCMIDGADGYNAFSRDETRKARKEHRCVECRRMIQPGETYHYLVALFDGDLSSDHCCQHCYVACEWLREVCSGWIVGSVLEDIEEHVREYMGTARLARLAIAMRRNWKYKRGPRAGQLMPVPAIPPKLQLGH